jgi:large repetitive protein
MALQTQSPSKAVIVSVGLAGAGGATNSSRPVMTGTADANTTVTLYDGARYLGTAVVSSRGEWSFTPTADIKAGKHQFTAISIDSENKWGAASKAMHVTVNATVTPPVAFVVNGLTDDAGHAITSDSTTTDRRPSISGTAPPGGTITLYDVYMTSHANVIGSVTVGRDGKWSITPTIDLSYGLHNVYAIEQNVAGTSSAASKHMVFDVRPLSDAPTILLLGEYDAYHINVGNVASGGTTACARLQLEGYSLPGALIKVYDGMTLLGSAVAKFNGTWAFYSEGWTSGQHDLSATQTNASHEVSPVSQHWIFTIGTGLHTMLGTGEFVDPVDPTVFVSARAAENPDDLVPSANITPVAPHAPIMGGKTRAVVPIDENTQKDTLPDITHATPLVSLVTVGEHEALAPTTSGQTVELTGDPAAYFKESTAHIQGNASGADTLHLAGDHQVIDLTSLSGKTAAAKISGIEVIDLGGQHNALKLSLVDVLNLGQQDLFRNDGMQQMMVNGKAGDTVDLSNTLIAGMTGGEWEQHGSALVGGVSYNVYEHSSAHTELLVQQGVLTALHN